MKCYGDPEEATFQNNKFLKVNVQNVFDIRGKLWFLCPEIQIPKNVQILSQAFTNPRPS